MPFLSIFVHFCISATIRIGQEIQCLPCAGFFLQNDLMRHYVNLQRGNIKVVFE